MSEKINSILEIKNKLNQVINLRKETISKIESYQNSIKEINLKKDELNTKIPLDLESIKLLDIQIAQFEALIYTLKINNENHVYNIDENLTTEQDDKFNLLIELFSIETKIYTKKENAEFDVIVTQIELDYILCKHKAIKFTTIEKIALIIYPSIILLEDDNNSFYIVPTSELSLNFSKKEVINNLENKIASNDKHEVEFTIPTMLNETFYFEDEQFISSFETKFIEYVTILNSLNAAPLKGIKKEYYRVVNEFGNKYFDFLNKLGKNELFISHINKQHPNSTLKFIETLGIIDLLKCFNEVADINNTTSNESFAIMFLQSKLNGLSILKYEDIVKLNDKVTINHYNELIKSVTDELNETKTKDSFKFNLAELLLNFDKELHTEYLSTIYQFASLVIKADGKITRSEEDSLKKIMNQSNQNSLAKILHKNDVVENEKTLEELLFDLYDLTGLQTVKQEINTLINLIKLKKAREEFELKNTDMSLHIVFSGNPGTGKTTVARHLAKIYKCLGVLKKGHLVETDRSGLIAEYVGQTAIKVNKLVDSALDGVLFIDEAYAIFSDEKDTYGKEAIATLLKRMEDDRERLIVVLAGYTDQMAMFINSNPGLKSRFNKYIDFPDYTPDELYSIFIGMSRKLNFVLEDALPDQLKLRFLEEIEKGDATFGNGRFVRNLFEKMLENQANRLAFDTKLNKDKLSLLKVEDLIY